MIREVISDPMYLLFLLIVLAVVVVIVLGLAVSSRDIGQWIFGYFRTLFGR